MFFLFLGPAASKAGRRYAAGLTGLFGPAAACGGLGLAFGHPSAALGLRRLRRLLTPLKAQLLLIS